MKGSIAFKHARPQHLPQAVKLKLSVSQGLLVPINEVVIGQNLLSGLRQGNIQAHFVLEELLPAQTRGKHIRTEVLIPVNFGIQIFGRLSVIAEYDIDVAQSTYAPGTQGTVVFQREIELERGILILRNSRGS